MLASLADLGYVVEWRVINAADYGMPQRGRRVFFLGYRDGTTLARRLTRNGDKQDWMLRDGLFAEAFPVAGKSGVAEFSIEGDLAEVTERFNHGKRAGRSTFGNTGVLVGRKVWTMDTRPRYDGPVVTLGDVLQPLREVPASFFWSPAQVRQWEYLKGGKNETRTNKEGGFTYRYSEGAMAFPGPLDRPARTIITGEGGSTPSRFNHVVRQAGHKLRRLTPVELERLNMFPDGHTAGVPDARRAFFMGNALVVGIVERVGAALANRIGGASAGMVGTGRARKRG